MEMNNSVIEILIPTYNRCDFLIKNLVAINEQIQNDKLHNQVAISISDNCSPDKTQQEVSRFKSAHPEVLLNYSKNEENIGLEPNAVKLLGQAQSDYILWLGDDDYLANGYLKFLIEQISVNENLGCVIPGLAALHADGSTQSRRNTSQELYSSKGGFETLLNWSHLAHQMSGILLKRVSLYDTYIKNPEWRNPYLFIFQTAYCLLRYDSLFAPKYEVHVSEFNAKDWGYNEVGLLDEVFKNYFYFSEQLSEEELSQLLLRFSVLHSYRYNISPFNPFRLSRQYRALIKSTPRLKGFASGLRSQLIKDYLLSFMR